MSDEDRDQEDEQQPEEADEEQQAPPQEPEDTGQAEATAQEAEAVPVVGFYDFLRLRATCAPPALQLTPSSSWLVS